MEHIPPSSSARLLRTQRAEPILFYEMKAHSSDENFAGMNYNYELVVSRMMVSKLLYSWCLAPLAFRMSYFSVDQSRLHIDLKLFGDFKGLNFKVSVKWNLTFAGVSASRDIRNLLKQASFQSERSSLRC